MDHTEELKALRRAIGQIGAAVDLLVHALRPDDESEMEYEVEVKDAEAMEPRDTEARAVVEELDRHLLEAKIALDRFDGLAGADGSQSGSQAG
jgi:hypothetical protein